MKKIIICLSIMFALMAVFVAADCAVPREDYTINSANKTTILCNGTYSLNDPTGDGAIIVNTKDAIIICNNTVLTGDMTISSVGIKWGGKNNVTITGCNFTHYDYGISAFYDNNNSHIYNNNFLHNKRGVGLTTRQYNNNVSYNYFYNSTSTGIITQIKVNTTIDHNTFILSSVDTQGNYSGKIINNLFYNVTGTFGIRLFDSKKSLVENNIFNISRLSSIQSAITTAGLNTNGLIIRDNIFDNIARYNIYGYSGRNILVESNKIIKCYFNESKSTPDRNTYGIAFFSSSSLNLSIINNNISKCRDGILIKDVSNNIIENNSIDNVDSAIDLRSTKQTKIENNYLFNCTWNQDTFDTCINVETFTTDNVTSNLTISNNRIIDFGSFGISIQRAENITILNNIINQVPFTTEVYARDWYEPKAAIHFQQIFKSFDSSSDERNSDNLTDHFYKFRVKNVLISGNSFDENTQMFLWNQGGSNIDHDLSNYWYRKVQFPFKVGNDVWLTDPDEFYISNNFDYLSAQGGGWGNSDTSRTQLLNKYYTWFSGAGSNPRWRMNYSISKTSIMFKNANKVGDYYMISVWNLPDPYNDLYNLTSSKLLYDGFSTGNITIGPGQAIRFGNYFTSFQNSLTTQERSVFFLFAFLLIGGGLFWIIQNPMSFASWIMIILGSTIALIAIRGML